MGRAYTFYSADGAHASFIYECKLVKNSKKICFGIALP